MANVELPYRAEYAESNRARCKHCKGMIEKGHLRLAPMIQSNFHGGKIPHWYHFNCFFRKQRPKSAADFSHIESLRYSDQENIRKQIDKLADKPGASTSASNKARRRKSAKKDLGGEFRVEYSKNSRARCRGCEEIIFNEDLRACKMDYESDRGRRFGGVPLWHHIDCFTKVRHDLEFSSCGTKLSGFNSLKKEDQVEIETMLPEIKPIKKGEPEKKPKFENQDILKKQNVEMFEYRDFLKTLPRKELEELLAKNEQEVPPGQERIWDRLADAMTFGALERCPSCKNGQLVIRSGVGYYCRGRNGWAKCESVFDDPVRKPFILPKALREKYAFLNKFQGKHEKRVLEKLVLSSSTAANSTSTLVTSIKSAPESSGPKVVRQLPLRGMEFYVVGISAKMKKNIRNRIRKLGGTIGNEIHNMTTAIISETKFVEKKSVFMEASERLNIQVVPENFIIECEKRSDPIAIINRMNLTKWGVDPSSRLSAAIIAPKRKISEYKSLVGATELEIQGDSAVESQLVSHVYRDPCGNIYNAFLALPDMQSENNFYCKIQVLESNFPSRQYWLFKSCGRTGTTDGLLSKMEEFTREEAVDRFKELFVDRTGNSWEDRKNFRRLPDRMVMLDVSCDNDAVGGQIIDVPSKRPKPVPEII